MSELTKQERQWIRKIQKLLNEPPSSDIGFFTIGDKSVSLYRMPEGDFEDTDKDFCVMVDESGVGLGELVFPNPVHATAG